MKQHTYTSKAGEKTILIEAETPHRDCKGCFYSIGARFLDCPEKCTLSTVNNAPIIYKRKID